MNRKVNMKDLKGKVAAITGAASGIGRMLSVNLAADGCNLAIADIDGQGLKETAAMIENGVNVSVHVIDVSDREQVYRFAEEAVKKHSGVDIVINNAGVALGDILENVSYEDFEWLMGINFWGVVYGTKAFLPYLRKRPEGHIVNISSINGILTNPNNGPYCTAKFAVKGFTETLAQELKDSNIAVSCVHPGGIKTNIARNTRFCGSLIPGMTKEVAVNLYEKELLKMEADKAAKIIISGIKKKERRIMVGTDAKVLDLITRLFPRTAVNLSNMLSRYLGRKYTRK
jgi:NAD(P)-dependent dehydrogenase (short-subunit alcohol dehydrogenase family)